MKSKFGQLEAIKDKIIIAYVDDYLSLREIAKKFNCSFSGAKRILHKYNIPRRNKCESLNLCPKSFTDKEIQILVGSLLGDGAITAPRGINGESQFYEGHCKRQVPYLAWKYQGLKRFIGCKIYILRHKLPNNVTGVTYNFLTRKSPLFTELRKKFYVDLFKESPKIIDRELTTKWMTPLTLAIWLMDDGHRASRNIVTIQTQSFSKEDNEFLADLLIDRFNLDCKLQAYRNGTGWILKIRDDKVSQIRQITKRHFHTCLWYKISDNPVETQSVYTKNVYTNTSGVSVLKCSDANTPSPVDLQVMV
ncbi:hypothetical protein LCGC14_1943540 [marine sediment metagenome]|uniref:Homing endonuclease LAGLIDADG domain-containing protein n=1 Tax=marine sediment metagenome TaxID=412755 RepID=A0A0F9FJV5_9ZZZZ